MVMPMPTIRAGGREKLDEVIADVVKNKSLPAIFLAAANADEIIYENQGGWVDFGKPEAGEVTVDTTLHLFSMTKFITSIAIHQLVDRGICTLNDPDIVAKHVPEIALDKLQILKGWNGDEPILEQAKTPITLAMLLSHSAGMCYEWSAPAELDFPKWRRLNNKPGMLDAGATMDAYIQPLIYEPGTSYMYSIGIDWAGFFLERITGQSLEEYMLENIFKPSGASTLTFYPKKEILDKLMKWCSSESPDMGGWKLEVHDELPMGKPTKPEDVTVLMGGGGLYGTTRDYLKVLQAILRSSPEYSGKHKGGKQLLSPESFKSLFTGVLPEPSANNNARAKLAEMMAHQHYQRPGGVPNERNVTHSPALAIYLEDGEFGRKAGSGCWDGALKTIMHLDPATGIVAECNTNVRTPGNNNPCGWTYNKFEKTLYEALDLGSNAA